MEIRQTDNPLWVEKFRPRRIEDCILPSGIKSTFQQYVDNRSVPNLLLAGKAGTGKTTIARALCDELDYDYIIINGSNEGRLIDTLRNRITQFASSVSMGSDRKVVIMDECLDENESVRVGTPESWVPMRLRDMQLGVEYPIVSVSMQTGEAESDSGTIISHKDDEIFEVELEDGRTIRLNAEHPFLVVDSSGVMQQKKLKDISVGDEIVSL